MTHGRPRSRRRALAWGVAASVAALVIAGCGDDDDSGSSGSSAPGAATAPAGANGTGNADVDLAWALKYTGGKAAEADSSKPPVTIGFANQQGGQQSFPYITEAARVAVELINEKLGGIDGHPLKLHECYVQSEEDGQQCGTEFVNDSSIKFLVNGLLVAGAEPLYATVDGKYPILSTHPSTAPDLVTKGVYGLGPGPTAVTAEAEFIAQEFPDAKSVAVMYQDNPAGKAALDFVRPVLDREKIKLTAVPVPDAASGPDVANAVQSAGAAQADVFLPIIVEAQCLATAQALERLAIRVPVVTGYWCFSDQVAEGLGGHPPEGWYFGEFGYSPWLDDTESGMTTFRQAMTAAGRENDIHSYPTVTGFGGILVAAKLGNSLGYDGLTPAALQEAMENFEGPLPLVAGDVDCGWSKAFPTLCTSQSGISQFKDGKMIGIRQGKTAIDVAAPAS